MGPAELHLEDHVLVHGRLLQFLCSSLLGLADNPGLRAKLIARVQCGAHDAERSRAARILRTLNTVLMGIDVVLDAAICGGPLTCNANDIVIGWRAVSGRDRAIFQQAPLGENHAVGGMSHAQPHVGDGVVLGAEERLLDRVVIGHGAPSARMLANGSARSVVTGVPAALRSQRTS